MKNDLATALTTLVVAVKALPMMLPDALAQALTDAESALMSQADDTPEVENCDGCGEPAEQLFTTDDDVELCWPCYREVPREPRMRLVDKESEE